MVRKATEIVQWGCLARSTITTIYSLRCQRPGDPSLVPPVLKSITGLTRCAVRCMVLRDVQPSVPYYKLNLAGLSERS